MTTIAANFTAEEKNADYRFEYMVHADKKSARKWKDLPIPFPARRGAAAPIKGDAGGTKQLAVMAPHIRVSRLPIRHEASANQTSTGGTSD